MENLQLESYRFNSKVPPSEALIFTKNFGQYQGILIITDC